MTPIKRKCAIIYITNASAIKDFLLLFTFKEKLLGMILVCNYEIIIIIIITTKIQDNPPKQVKMDNRFLKAQSVMTRVKVFALKEQS